MRILLTGATGFVGTAMHRRLAGEGHDVVCLTRRPIEAGPTSTNWIIRDIEDICAQGAPGGAAFDRVFHFAAAGVAPDDRHAQRLIDVNIRMGARLLEEIDAQAFVFAGSCAEYMRKESGDYVEGDPLQQDDAYGATKAAGGLVHLALAHRLDKHLAHLRLFHVYGPGESPHRLTTSLLRSLAKRTRVALSPGDQVRDFVFVDDVLSAFDAAARGLVDGALKTGAYNVCTGQAIEVKEVCRRLAATSGADAKLLGFGDIPMRQNELMRLVGGGDALHKAVGWRPAVTLDDGLTRLWAAYARNQQDQG